MAELVLAVGPGPDQTGYPTAALTPVVDGVDLIARVIEFEEQQGFEPVGGYAALVPGSVGMTDAGRYYSGATAYLLGCTCGEAGCWPLEARIVVESHAVTWTGFCQPHRPDRDYGGFGPFVFLRPAYERAVATAVTALGGARR